MAYNRATTFEKGKQYTMLTTVEGVYKDGKIELNETPAGLDGARVLVTFLPDIALVSQPQVLYGAWQGTMPDDLDLDAALKEIRGEWMQEWEADKHE
jgi:hypothetical protein